MYILPKKAEEIRYRLKNSKENYAAEPVASPEQLAEIPKEIPTKTSNYIVEYEIGTSNKTGSMKQELILHIDDILAIHNTPPALAYKIKCLRLILATTTTEYHLRRYEPKLKELEELEDLQIAGA